MVALKENLDKISASRPPKAKERSEGRFPRAVKAIAFGGIAKVGKDPQNEVAWLALLTIT